jgi:hypothetical protein
MGSVPLFLAVPALGPGFWVCSRSSEKGPTRGFSGPLRREEFFSLRVFQLSFPDDGARTRRGLGKEAVLAAKLLILLPILVDSRSRFRYNTWVRSEIRQIVGRLFSGQDHNQVEQKRGNSTGDQVHRWRG